MQTFKNFDGDRDMPMHCFRPETLGSRLEHRFLRVFGEASGLELERKSASMGIPYAIEPPPSHGLYPKSTHVNEAAILQAANPILRPLARRPECFSFVNA